MKEDLCAVWPIVEGLEGVDHLTNKTVKLNTFQKGFMYRTKAEKSQDEGKLQMMVGLDMKSLIHPGDNAHLKIKETKVVEPEKPKEEVKEEPKKAPLQPRKKASYKTKVTKPE